MPTCTLYICIFIASIIVMMINMTLQKWVSIRPCPCLISFFSKLTPYTHDPVFGTSKSPAQFNSTFAPPSETFYHICPYTSPIQKCTSCKFSLLHKPRIQDGRRFSRQNWKIIISEKKDSYTFHTTKTKTHM